MMASESGSKRTKMIVLGCAVMVIGLVAAVALWLAGGSRRTDAVANLARAPIGCDTTLDFSVPGDYLIFVESKGSFADVRGDCDSSGEFEVGASRPDLDITVLDPAGRQLELTERSDTATYSTDEFVGRSVLSIEIEEAGDHVMRVEAASDAQFAVAVGRDPNSGVALLRGAAVAVGLVGLVVGLLLALVAGRKRQPAGPGWTPAQPGGQPLYQQPNQPPYQQPGQPPYQQPGQPPYGQPPYVHPGGQPQPQAGQQPYFAPGQAPPNAGGPPVYGGTGQPGHSGQATPAPVQPGQPVPLPPSVGDVSSAPQAGAGSPYAPVIPTVNPFAPPGGVRHEQPIDTAESIPGQPVLPGVGGGDGERGWPGDTDDDAPTPPRGQPSMPPADVPPDVDRWDTSRQSPPD